MMTFNEEIHIERCIRSLQPLAAKIFVVDSFSTDRTLPIAESLGAVVAQRKWKNYADQFQWALDNYSTFCGAQADWVMRMDADEYLEPDLQQELQRVMAGNVPDDVDGFYIRRKVFFYGKWIRHGGFYPHTLLRIWRNGQGRIEQRWMDEHIVLPPGSKTRMLKGHLVDDNLKGITFWVNKCNSYATREMIDLLNNKYDLFEKDEAIKSFDDPQAKRKRMLKDRVYSKMPIGVRAFAYFFYRYFFKLGFLDGSKGLVFHTMQGLWYRLLVDVKLMEIESKSGGDPSKIRRILKDDYGITL